MPHLLENRETIAAFLHISVGKLQAMIPEMEKAGVVFALTKGRPPKKVWCAWDTAIINWTSLKAEKGESL